MAKKLFSLRKLFSNSFPGHRGRKGIGVGGSLPRSSGGGSPYEKARQEAMMREHEKNIDRAFSKNPALKQIGGKGKIFWEEVDRSDFFNIVQPWISDNAMSGGSVDRDKAMEALWQFAKRTDIPSDQEFPEEWSEWLDQAIEEIEG